MGSQRDLFGYYKPPLAITIRMLLDDPGGSQAGLLTVMVEHHRPTPALVMQEHLDEYEAHDVPSIVGHLWRAWERPSDAALQRKFLEAVTDVHREYVR